MRLGTGRDVQPLRDRASGPDPWVAVCSLLLAPNARASCLLLWTPDAVTFGRYAVPRAATAELADCVSMSVAARRAIAPGLSPVNADRGSPRDALERLASESGRRRGITVTVREIGEPVIVAEAAGDDLGRITYAGITNAARHARCPRVDLELRTERETGSIIARNDGKTPATPDRDPGGLGLKMMACRARCHPTDVRLEPAAGSGSCLIATLSLATIRADGEAGKNWDDSRKAGWRPGRGIARGRHHGRALLRRHAIVLLVEDALALAVLRALDRSLLGSTDVAVTRRGRFLPVHARLAALEAADLAVRQGA